MPRFNVLKCDADPSLLKLKGFLAKKGVYLLVKRGPRSLGLLDIYLKQIKTKIITYLKIHPKASFPSLLKAVIKSYNMSYSDVLKGTPAQFNSNYFDAILRHRLYKDQPALQPFKTWVKEQLKAQKKSLEPRRGPLKNRDDFRVLDLCFIAYRDKKIHRNWSRQYARDLYRVERVVTAHGSPYSYQLRDVMTNQIMPGYFSSDELTLVDFKNYTPDQVLGEKFKKGGQKWLLVSFKHKSGQAFGRFVCIAVFETFGSLKLL